MNNNLRIGLGLIVIFAAAVLIFYYYMNTRLARATLRVGQIKLSVEVADTFQKKFQGLSGRDSLCENCGMIFVYNAPQKQQFTMRGMKFPLDIIFIRDGKVVEIWENVPAPRAGARPINIDSRLPADQVLEVNAGFVKKNYVKLGDSIDLS